MAGQIADSHSRLLFDVFSAALLLLTALLGELPYKLLVSF